MDLPASVSPDVCSLFSNMTNAILTKSIKKKLMLCWSKLNYMCNLLWLQVEAVKLIAEGKAPRLTQPEEGATYECIQKKENAKVI